MFLGHYAAGLAAKKAAPQTSLGVLFAAVQLPDLLWPLFLLAGWEHVDVAPGHTAFTPLAFTHYPFTHSLLGVLAWSCGASLLYGALTRYRRGAVVVGLAVLSHWLLDAVVHVPDLPVLPGVDLVVGLGLWNAVLPTVALETAMLGAGVWAYVRAVRPIGRRQTLALGALVATLVLVYVGNLAGPPPADERSLAWFALGAWLFPLWAVWAERAGSAERGRLSRPAVAA